MPNPLLYVLAACAALQVDGPAPDPADGLLAGPRVPADAPARLTIVERTFDGALVPLEDEPEIVAAYRVVADPRRRERLDAIAGARSRAFEEILLAHYEAITGLGTAMATARDGGPEERAALMSRLREVNQAMVPFRARGSFLDECRDELSAEESAEVRRMVAEWRAANEAGLATSPDAAAPGRARGPYRLQTEDLGSMVRRTLQRRAASRTAQFEAFAQQLDLSPEQAEKVRALFMEIAVHESQGKREAGVYSRREREELFGEMARILDERQRLKLGELMTGMTAPGR
jgi:hypothetical protein